VTEPSLLLLIPAYNEEARIEPVLREFGAYFRDHYRAPFQLVVVLNGCRDNTRGVVEKVAKDFPSISLLDFPAPIGKGGALIEGLKLAGKADAIGYVDADGASPPNAFHDLVKRLGEADCVIGSRWLPGAVLHQAQPWVRRFTSRCFHLVVESLFLMHIKDTQCPCKVMRRPAVEKIFDKLCIADLAFDVNLLVSLKRAGGGRPKIAGWLITGARNAQALGVESEPCSCRARVCFVAAGRARPRTIGDPASAGRSEAAGSDPQVPQRSSAPARSHRRAQAGAEGRIRLIVSRGRIGGRPRPKHREAAIAVGVFQWLCRVSCPPHSERCLFLSSVPLER